MSSPIAEPVKARGTEQPATPLITTGGGGWLGQALLAAIAASNDRGEARRPVRCLARDASEAARITALAPEADIVVGDIRDPLAVEKLLDGVAGGSIIHAAGLIHPSQQTRELFDVNVGGTALVLDAARRARIRRIVHVSSNSPFGFNRSSADAFDESSEYDPYLSYGRSKMEAEVLVRRYGARGSLETVIVRCPWFYGPYQPARQTRFLTMVRRGIFPLSGNGTNRRSMAFTGNLAHGLLLAERTASAAGRVYWIADAKPYTLREILETTRQALEDEGLSVSRRSLRMPGAISDIARLGDRLLQGRGRYSQQLHVMAELNQNIACDISRAVEELGYRPDVALHEGMRRSVRWCIDNGISI